ncbi:GCN1 domain-containing protein [Cryptosporidium canis]|uniref:GCN1 domain-containing protein n=1 Tax=Cryptosporidium canis TaxID=195482 RepID=A0ABQ8PC92_9CRYT|nr:GCN1 domain-containing protein [Cryptosporidium canis]
MCGGAARDEQSVRLVDDLIEIQVAPVVSALQQRNISRSILRVSGGECCYSSTVEKVVARSSRVFDGFDKRRVFSAGDWPSALTRSLISSMVPSTIRHFDSVLPRFGDASLGKMVSRIQARHALRGLVFTLSDLVASLDGSDSRLIELCIRFVLTQVVDSVVFEDYVSEAERMSASGTADEGLKGKDKAVRNLVGSFGGRQDSPEKIQIQNSDVSSRESLQEAVIGLFVSLSSRPDIQSLSSGILTILRDLSSQYKPRISPREFHNCLAFAIGSIASCCSSSDPVVYTVTCKIMNELLGGSLVRNGGGAEAHDSASKTRLPVLEDIPQEYSRILPRLFSMLYGSQEARQEPTLCRFEALDRDKYLDYRMDSGDSPGAEKLSVYEIYSISLCKALYSESPAERVGAAHIFGSLSKGISARRLRDFGILEAMEGVLRSPDGQKSSEAGSLEGVLLCIGSLSLYLGYMIEPYTIQFLKSLMHLFSGGDQRIRFYSEKSAEVIIKNLSRRSSGGSSSRFGFPSKGIGGGAGDSAQDGLADQEPGDQLHLPGSDNVPDRPDGAELQEGAPVFEVGDERGGTDLKKDAIQVLTCLLLLLSDRSDVDPFLPLIENSIHITLTDPIPEIRLLTAKLCRALVTVTGQEKSSSLLSWLFRTLAMEVGQTLKSGVSASLAEVLSAFGIDKFKKILPFIVSQIQKMDDDGNGDDESPPHPGDASDPVSSSGPASAASVREGYIGLFVYLPQSFGEDLGPLMPGILPVLLSRLGDEVDSVREVALKACKALVVHSAQQLLAAGDSPQQTHQGSAGRHWPRPQRALLCPGRGRLLDAQEILHPGRDLHGSERRERVRQEQCSSLVEVFGAEHPPDAQGYTDHLDPEDHQCIVRVQLRERPLYRGPELEGPARQVRERLLQQAPPDILPEPGGVFARVRPADLRGRGRRLSQQVGESRVVHWRLGDLEDREEGRLEGFGSVLPAGDQDGAA